MLALSLKSSDFLYKLNISYVLGLLAECSCCILLTVNCILQKSADVQHDNSNKS